jgi:hypothetical protein
MLCFVQPWGEYRGIFIPVAITSRVHVVLSPVIPDLIGNPGLDTRLRGYDRRSGVRKDCFAPSGHGSTTLTMTGRGFAMAPIRSRSPLALSLAGEKVKSEHPRHLCRVWFSPIPIFDNWPLSAILIARRSVI